MNWTYGRKTVEIARHHRVHCASVAPGFVAPSISDEVEFDRYDLLLSIGRSLAMRTASVKLVKALAAGRSPLLKHLVDNHDATFQLSSEVADLGDAALTSLSHDIGVGVSGLHMESMDYVWRANGRELMTPGGRIPDYVWDTGRPNAGVVVSEAKGATTLRADFDAVDARAREGFFGQVLPRVGETTVEGDLVVAGYAFGVFAAGGQDARTAAYETMDFAAGPPDRPGGTPSVSILRSHFAGVMRLLGIEDDGDDYDALVEGRMSFAVFGDERQQFVVPEREPFGRLRSVRLDSMSIPALSLEVAARALELLFGDGPSRDGRITWPRYPFRPERLPRGVLALASDGLALVSRFGRLGGRDGRRGPGGPGVSLRWKPGAGFSSVE